MPDSATNGPEAEPPPRRRAALDHAGLVAFVEALGGCSDDHILAWLRQECAGCDLAAAWERCESPGWLFRGLYRVGIPRERIVLAACAAARLPVARFREGADPPLECIEVTERWCRGEARLEELRAARSRAEACAEAYSACVAAACAGAEDDADPYTAADASAYAACAAAGAAYSGHVEAAATDAARAAGDAAAASASDAAAAADARRAMERACCAAIRATVPLADVEERIAELRALLDRR